MTDKLKINTITIDKGLAALGSALILSALAIIAATPRASGYEVSIYNAYPNYFWAIIILSFICGLIILIHNAFSVENQHSHWYLAGLIIIIATNLTVITLPIFRGYYISDLADEVSHLGMIKDIMLNGHLGVSNFYPIPHILAYQIVSVTGLDERFVIKIIPSMFYLIYMAGLFLLSREISRNTKITLVVMVLGSPLLFTYFNYILLPTHFLLYILPLILFLFFRFRSVSRFSYSLLLLLLFLVIPFIHPLGSLFIVAMFVILGVSNMIQNSYLTRNGTAPGENPFSWKVVLPPAVFILVLFISWFSNFTYFDFTVNKIYDSFTNQGGVSPLDILIQQQQIVKFSTFELIKLIINNYGHILIYILLMLLASGIVVKNLFSKGGRVKIEDIFFLLVFLILIIFYMATLTGSFIVTGRSIRILCWPLVAGILLAAMVFHGEISRLRPPINTITITALTVIIIISSIIGLFSVYASPTIKATDLQATLANMTGMQWFTGNKNSSDTLHFSPFVDRAPYYIYGQDSPKPNSLGRFYYVPRLITQETYVIISNYDLVGKKLFPDVGVYTMDQLDSFRSHQGVNRIYFNGDIDIYEVSISMYEN